MQPKKITFKSLLALTLALLTVLSGVLGLAASASSAIDVKLDKSAVTLKVGESVKLEPAITVDDSVRYTVVYTSTDDNVASVEQTGVISANDVGSATITVTVTDLNGGSVSDSVKVTVKSGDSGFDTFLNVLKNIVLAPVNLIILIVKAIAGIK